MKIKDVNNMQEVMPPNVKNADPDGALSQQTALRSILSVAITISSWDFALPVPLILFSTIKISVSPQP